VSKLNLDEFEKVLCYKALFDSTYLATIVDYIKPKYFSNKNISTVFTAISTFYEKRGKIPTTTEVRTYLSTEEHKQTFKSLLESLKDIDRNLDKDELYENTQQFLKEKSVYHSMLEIANDISLGKVDTSAILNKIETSCNISLVTDRGFDLYRDVDILIDDILNVQKTIPTTWPWLDENLGGGLLENGRALYVFAGETNIGKSIFLGNIATNIVNQGKNVLLISLEMSELLYARRLCSNISKIPIRDLATNTHSLRQAIHEHKEAGKGQLFIKEFPPSTITPNQLKAFIKKIIDQGIKIDCIVLDYLNLLHSPIGSNSYERVKYVTEQVRSLSYVFNCPIVSATQIARCLDVDTEVETLQGIKTINDLKVGEHIKGSNGYVEVKYIYPREVKKCYKLITKSGREIICSADHIFPTSRGNTNISSGLSVGDMLFSATQ
jgi:replicative DNA helicase